MHPDDSRWNPPLREDEWGWREGGFESTRAGGGLDWGSPWLAVPNAMAGERSMALRHEDEPHYLRWREEQLSRCDADYADWRRQRTDRFYAEFEHWRRERGQGLHANRGYAEPQGEAAGSGASAHGHATSGLHADADPDHPHGPGGTQAESTSLFFERS